MHVKQQPEEERAGRRWPQMQPASAWTGPCSLLGKVARVGSGASGSLVADMSPVVDGVQSWRWRERWEMGPRAPLWTCQGLGR